MALQRRAVLRVAPGVATGQGGADRRGERRVIRRLCPLWDYRNQRWMRWYRAVPRAVRDGLRKSIATSGLLSGEIAGRSSTHRSGAWTTFSRSSSTISTARFPTQSSEFVAEPRFSGNGVSILSRPLGAASVVESAGANAVRRPEDLSGGTAHEAGSDEHGRVDG